MKERKEMKREIKHKLQQVTLNSIACMHYIAQEKQKQKQNTHRK